MNDGYNLIQLKLLINEVFGVDNINLDMEVNKLQTVSEDNDRFMGLFKTKFNIDMNAFDYYEYFDEDEFILISIFRRVFRTKKEKKLLTVGHLLSIINKREWFEPDPDPRSAKSLL
ncbi:DUF1493 family protein [Flavobacterium sp. N502540]|uniref:DUF1493 family protein n=1 Tax=Flavobacterium sp. N502540 TaxID=2986838 RepID=UPI002224C441|nr:DUF1493 family protein [Flavobacterium sp. N502540]